MTTPTPPRLTGRVNEDLASITEWAWDLYRALIIENDVTELDLTATAPLVYTSADRGVKIDNTGTEGDILKLTSGAWVASANTSGGDVQGPSSAVITEVAVFNAVTGKEIATVPVRIDALGNVTQVKDLTATGTLSVATAFTGTAVLDEDNMASDSNTKIATQQSIKAYVDTEIATVGGNTLRNITSTDSFGASDDTLNCTSGTFTVTLPTAVSASGKIYILKNSGAGVISLATTSSQTVDGYAPSVITLNTGDSLSFQSDGSNWIVVGAV